MNHAYIILGAGRMGEGIALALIYAGADAILVDLKDRPVNARAAYYDGLQQRVRVELGGLVNHGLITDDQADSAMTRLSVLHQDDFPEEGRAARVIFEALPEVRSMKDEAFAWAADLFAPDAVIASTASTFLVSDLATGVPHPERFLNAHWLNPAHLMPLVEVSRSELTSDAAVEQMTALLRQIGKVPVVMKSTPGYVVPRIQVLIMNEAARMAAEGVATPEEIDTAIRLGLGLRYSVLGALEFVDWGGGDILYYAADYMAETVSPRFAAPQVIADNMENKRTGFRDGVGFFDYQGVNLDQYRERRIKDFLERLTLLGQMPEFDAIRKNGDQSAGTPGRKP